MNRFLSGSFVGALGMALITMPLMAQAQNNNGNTVHAPFQVLGASGQPILKIEEVDGSPRLTLLGHGTSKAVLGDTGDGMALVVSAAPGQLVSLNAASHQASVNVLSGEMETRLLTDANEQSLVMQRAGTKVVDLGSKASTNAALRIASPSGAMAAQIGSNKANGGAGAVYVNDTSGKTTGYVVSLANGEGVVGVSLNGQDIAKLEANTSKTGGKVSIADTNGNLVFNAGLTSAGEGTACIYNAKGQKCF